MKKKKRSGTLQPSSIIFLWLFFTGALTFTGHPQEIITVDSLIKSIDKNELDQFCKNEDAVIVFQHRAVRNTYRVSSYTSKYWNFSRFDQKYWPTQQTTYKTWSGNVETVTQIIRILTQKGAELYSKIYIPKNRNEEILGIEAMTIKPDGKTITLDQNDIKEVQSMTNGTFSWEQAHYRFSLPGVEAGDILDIRYHVRQSKHISTSGDYFFSSYLPVFISTVQLQFSHTISVDVKSYNGLQEPKQMNDFAYHYYIYTRYHLGALRDMDHANQYKDLPFCRYQIFSIHGPEDSSPIGTMVSENNWTDFSKNVVKMVQEEKYKGAKSGYLKKYVAGYYNKETMMPQPAFRKLLRNIFDSIKVGFSDQKAEYTSGYYLYKHSIPISAINNLCRDLFTHLGIDFYYCMSSPKNGRSIDTLMVSGEYFSDVFFAYKDEKDSLRFVFPLNSVAKINPEEINPFTYGSTCLMISAKNPGQHSFGTLPDYSSAISYKKRKNMIRVDLDKNVLSYDCRTIRAGALAYIDKLSLISSKDSLNTEMEEYFKSEMKNFRLDTSYYSEPDTAFPYKTNFLYRGHQADKIVRVADSMYLIDLSEWLDHTVLPAFSSDRFVDYYPDFRYQEQFSYNYFFNTPVEVQNPSALSGGIVNNFGSYQFRVEQVSDTLVVVQSTYRIARDQLPASDYDHLKQLYDQWNLYKNSSFMVRVKPKSAGKNAENL